MGCSCNYYKNRHKIFHSVAYLSPENCLFFDVLCCACASLFPVLLCCVVCFSSPPVLSAPQKAGPRHPVLVEHSAHNTTQHRLAHDEERRSAPRSEPAPVSRRPAGGQIGAEEAGREKLGTEALRFCKNWGRER